MKCDLGFMAERLTALLDERKLALLIRQHGITDAGRCHSLPIFPLRKPCDSLTWSGIPQASQKMLTQHLRELERDGIVTRTIYPEVPPRVEYRLTDLGKGLRPVFWALADWADKRQPQKEAPQTGELARAC